jgi:nucleotide-binding universal stress UspA family protein
MNILIPTDFSDNAYHAIRYVYHNFKREACNITIMHIIQAPHKGSGMLLRLDDLMKEDAERDMKQLLNQLDSDFGDQPETVIRQGDLKEWLDIYTSEKKLDLVVMGTKGETNLPSRLMGSVTESFIRVSEVPVLAVPLEFDREEVHYVAIANGKGELQNADFIRKMVDAMNTRNLHLDVLCVDTGNEQLSLPKSINHNGFQVGVKCVTADSVVEGINQFIETNHVDVIGIYHQHNSRMDYLFNRSLTKTICANNAIPVLAIPDHD